MTWLWKCSPAIVMTASARQFVESANTGHLCRSESEQGCFEHKRALQAGLALWKQLGWAAEQGLPTP